MSKIAERHIMLVIRHDIELGLPPNQFGFRAGRSTVDALIKVETEVTQGWHMCTKAGKSGRVGIVAIDLAKAFDKVAQSRIIQTLESRFKINPHALGWIASFIKERTQFVQVRSARSALHVVASGVPQGSCLGPMLFVAAISHLQEIQLSINANLTLFADDIMYTKPLIDEDSRDEMIDDLHNIMRDIEGGGHTINVNKTTYMVVRLRKSMPNVAEPPLVVRNELIMPSESVKYLGMTLDAAGLTFKQHIREKAVKARRALGHISGILSRWGMRSVVGQIYRVCIRPAMTYALPLMYGIQRQGDDRLHRVDRLADSIVTRRGGRYCQSRNPLAPSQGTSRLQLRINTIHQYVHGHRHCPDQVRLTRPVNRTRTRGSDEWTIQWLPTSRSTRVANSFLRRAISDYKRS